MTNEDKELLLKDICARLPYGLKVLDVDEEIGTVKSFEYPDTVKDDNGIFENDFWLSNDITEVKPYLRPLSSMTEEERSESREWIMLSIDSHHNKYFDGFGNISADDTLKAIDWLNAHHFDYRGLIERGLALKAKEGMYD